MKRLVGKKVWVVFMALVFIGMAAGGAWAAGTVASSNGVTVFTQTGKTAGAIDFKNAKPMPLPQATTEPGAPWESAAPASTGTPGFSPGNIGSGKAAIPSVLFDAADEADSQFEDPIGPQEYGTSKHVFTTSRVDLSGNNESKTYPNRAAGKLYFKIWHGKLCLLRFAHQKRRDRDCGPLRGQLRRKAVLLRVDLRSRSL